MFLDVLTNDKSQQQNPPTFEKNKSFQISTTEVVKDEPTKSQRTGGTWRKDFERLC